MIVKVYLLCTTVESQPFTHFRGRVEKTNKSELWNPLIYRVLIYIFEVGMKTFFFSTEKFRGWNPNFKRKKRPHFYLLKLAIKDSHFLQCTHLVFSFSKNQFITYNQNMNGQCSDCEWDNKQLKITNFHQKMLG